MFVYTKQLQNAVIENQDYRITMRQFRHDPNCFMFLDPPYHNTLGYTSTFGAVFFIILKVSLPFGIRSKK